VILKSKKSLSLKDRSNISFTAIEEETIMPLFDLLQQDFHKTLHDYKQKVNVNLTKEELITVCELHMAIQESKNGVQLRFYMEQRISSLPKTLSYYLPWTDDLRYDLEQVLKKEAFSLNHLLLDQNVDLQEQNIKLQKEVGDLTLRLEAFQKMTVSLKDGLGQTTPYTLFDITRLTEQLNRLNDTVMKQGEEIALVKGECTIYQRQAETLRKEKEVLAEKIKQLEEQNAHLVRVNKEQATDIQQLLEERGRSIHTFEIVHPPAKKIPFAPLKKGSSKSNGQFFSTEKTRERLPLLSP
jgi:hypothetical protein